MYKLTGRQMMQRAETHTQLTKNSSVCVCVWYRIEKEALHVSVCVCIREREREKNRLLHVCVYGRERETDAVWKVVEKQTECVQYVPCI